MYSLSGSPRLQYIVNFFSQELFDHPIRITHSRDEYSLYRGPKINYSDRELSPDDFLIVPVSLLFEKDIRPQPIECFSLNFHKAFFETAGSLRFDIFAAAFYLLSRYEEYLPHEKDIYGRFSHTSSLAFREGFLMQPLINFWLHDFKQALRERFPTLRFKGSEFANLITYDIDIAYAYLCKGWWRNIGGTLRSLLKGQWREIIERWQVLAGLRKDPFDCYEWLDALQLYCRLKPYFFFLVARKPSPYDKNVATSAKRFRDLIEYYAGAYHAGIHPSWQSGDDHALLKEELEWLQVVADKEIVASRQHYIRFTLPGTYRRLINAGIRKDYSMGYGTINGFRASVASCFQWYDLEREESTSLNIYPFCFMDANSFYEEKHSTREAYEELTSLYNSVRKVNGMMITIWHNSLLGKGSEDWAQMFELFMKETVYWDAYYDGSREVESEPLKVRF
jgi:hypothetical protein